MRNYDFQPNNLRLLSTSTHPTIYFTGIQPTGIPHLGNFFGSIEPWTELQNSVDKNILMMLSVVDQHAISLGPLPANEVGEKFINFFVFFSEQKCLIFREIEEKYV